MTRPSRTRPSWPRTGWHTVALAPTRAPTAPRPSPTLPSWQPTASRTAAPARTRARTAQRPLATVPSWQPTSGPTRPPAPTRALTAPSPSATPPSWLPTDTRTMPRRPAPTLVPTAPRLFHSPPNWLPIAYVMTPPPRRAARPPPDDIAAPAAARPLARDASCSFTNAATTRRRVRGSGSEPSPWLTGPLCRQLGGISKPGLPLVAGREAGPSCVPLGSHLKGGGTLCSPSLGKGRECVNHRELTGPKPWTWSCGGKELALVFPEYSFGKGTRSASIVGWWGVWGNSLSPIVVR